MSADNLPEKGAGRGGMSTLDLLGGSVAVNRVVKMMLHKNRMTFQELCDAVDQLPAEKRMTREELSTALEELVGKDWLTQTEEGGQPVYQVVLRPKASSAEQLHSDNLPQIEVAVDKDVNPGFAAMGAKPAAKKKSFMDTLREWFGVK